MSEILCNLLTKLIILNCHHGSSSRIHHHSFLIITSSKSKAGRLDLGGTQHTDTSYVFILIVVLGVGVSETLGRVVHNLSTFSHHLVSLILYLAWISRVILVRLSHTSCLRKSLLMLSKLHIRIITSIWWRCFKLLMVMMVMRILILIYYSTISCCP